jgi:hypothetical protein
MTSSGWLFPARNLSARTGVGHAPARHTLALRLPGSGVGGMVLKIAHQVVRTSCSRAPRRSARDPHPSPKKILTASCRAFLPLPFPRPLGKSAALPAQTANRHCSCARLANPGRGCTPTHVARHEKTPLTLLTLREALLFADSVSYQRVTPALALAKGERHGFECHAPGTPSAPLLESAGERLSQVGTECPGRERVCFSPPDAVACSPQTL